MLTYHSNIFWCSNCLEKLYQGQCSLTVIKLSLKAHTFFVSKVFKKIKSQTIWFENIGQFLWKAHSVQDKIWIAPYCHLKDSTYIAIKNFLLLEIFLKNFNQRHDLIHIVHLVNFGQSLFLIKQSNVWNILIKVWTLLPFQGFCISFHWKLFFATWNIFGSFNQGQ